MWALLPQKQKSSSSISIDKNFFSLKTAFWGSFCALTQGLWGFWPVSYIILQLCNYVKGYKMIQPNLFLCKKTFSSYERFYYRKLYECGKGGLVQWNLTQFCCVSGFVRVLFRFWMSQREWSYHLVNKYKHSENASI